MRSETLEAQIIMLLLDKYELTVEELLEQFHLPPSRIERSLKGLEKRGILQIEEYGDITYLRLLRRDIRFVGRKVTQKRALKQRKSKSQQPSQPAQEYSEPKEYDGFMYQ